MTHMASRFFWHAYSAAPRDVIRPGALNLHQVRGGVAFSLVSARLCHMGWTYAGPIFNRSPQIADKSRLMANQPGIIVQTTRPPLDDSDMGRPIPRSGTRLETAILSEVRRCFAFLDRSRVQVSDALAQLVNDEDRDRANIEYRIPGSAR